MKITTKCCVCHKIRTEAGQWIEQRAASEGEVFSHGYCPECFEKALEELDEDSQSLQSAVA
jgi:hypothetical protein